MTSMPLSRLPADETYEALYRQAPCGYVSTAADGTLLKVNDTFLQWSGYSEDELIGKLRLQDLLTVAGKVFYETHYGPLLTMQGFINGVAFDLVAKNRKRLSFFCNSRLQTGPDGQAVGIRTIVFDAGDRRLYEKELLIARRVAQKGKARLEYLAGHDYLTNLPNRHSFAIRLDEALARARQRRGTLAVLFVDLDHINDSWGHDVGDRVLVGLAERFLADSDPQHTVARMGGEEFVFLLEGADEADAHSYASRLLPDLSRPFEISDAVISVGASIGIAMYPEGGATGQELMRNADRAMYTAKMAGGYRAVVHTPEAAARHAAESLLRQALPMAVRQQRFVLHYQPKLDLRTNTIVGAEALIRWDHPDHAELLYPASFLHLVEASPVRQQVFAWTIDEVCRQIAAWASESGLQLPVSVNLSAWQLSDATLPQVLTDAIERHGISIDKIQVEITEGALIADETRAAEILNQLAASGFAISLDDFGTGYSGLAHLKRYPIRGIKLDMAFIQGLADDAGARNLVRAIVAFGKSVGMEVLAEGVETSAQRDFLSDIGCDAIQGYLIARPLPGDQFETLALGWGAAPVKPVRARRGTTGSPAPRN
jgi:diguanylate cyclase (GGDEF)-like protein/PAS domain S-box-containing protein